ncbi:MAG: hypothetical protein IK141_05250 [Clostridia bacterium]|nr:hypothetical protein [Clostridia bacterium]
MSTDRFFGAKRLIVKKRHKIDAILTKIVKITGFCGKKVQITAIYVLPQRGRFAIIKDGSVDKTLNAKTKK